MEEKSLFEQLQRNAESDRYPYHMPGHKRMQTGKIPADLLELDITEIEGFDNLHQPQGILKSLQEKANALYGAEETFYLVNGSTCGILSAISAALPEGGSLLLDRNSHKSAYHAAYLRDLKLAYIYPGRVEGFEIAEAVTPSAVERALRENPDTDAVFIVSPTYEGRIADVRAIAKIVHGRGIPLIVDEAHGAHLGFGEGFAKGSCALGADLVIHSVHKTLPAMTQTALLHVNGNLIDRARLRRFLHIYQSSSPSYVLMASIEDALDSVAENGRERFALFRERYQGLLERLSDCRNFTWISRQDIESGKQDIGKLMISAKKADISGKRIYDILLEQYHLQCEMAAGDHCLAMFTVADGQEAYDRMEAALLELDALLSNRRDAERGSESDFAHGTRESREFLRPPVCFSLKTAWDMPWETTELIGAVGRPAADFVNLYPPGVPLLVPGEVVTQEMYEEIAELLRRDLDVQGISRENGKYWIKVLSGDNTPNK